MKVKCFFPTPLYDSKIGGRSWMTRMTVNDYLSLVDLKNNPYQRNILSVKLYNKLINDLLHDTVIPPISIVYPEVDLKLDQELDTNKTCSILDGLQRTNSLLQCLDRIEKGKGEGSTFTKDQFLDKEIYVEIWERLELKNILYKMVVLNTGQKKMDYSHQLDILNENVLQKLRDIGVSVNTQKDKTTGNSDFMLADIVEGLVSFINKYPISGKKNAAEFLFDRFEISIESDEADATLSIIDDPKTYDYLKWVIKDFSDLLDSVYRDKNPLKQYNAFLVGLFASLGSCYSRNPKRLDERVQVLVEKFETDKDPVRLAVFQTYYNRFKSGIGEKRRKFVFEAFRSFFLGTTGVDTLEWDETYERVF